MSKITVFRVRIYDVTSDEMRLSGRMATEKGAALMRGEILPETAVEIDPSQLEPGEEWTPRNFALRGHLADSGGFQTQVYR